MRQCYLLDLVYSFDSVLEKADETYTRVYHIELFVKEDYIIETMIGSLSVFVNQLSKAFLDLLKLVVVRFIHSARY